METKIDVEYFRHEYYVSEPDPESSWDNGSTAADWGILGIKFADRYSEITVDFEVLKGKTYYLVVVDYNSGDSFGSYDNCLEFVDLFETLEAAENAAEEVRTPEGYSYHYTRNNGRRISVSCPWVGYFESLNDITVHPVKLID